MTLPNVEIYLSSQDLFPRDSDKLALDPHSQDTFALFEGKRNQQYISFSLTAQQITIVRQENALTSLPRPHYTHSPNDAESASNLAPPS